MRTTKLVTILSAILVLAVASAGSAFAGNGPSSSVYGHNPQGQICGHGSNGSTSGTPQGNGKNCGHPTPTCANGGIKTGCGHTPTPTCANGGITSGCGHTPMLPFTGLDLAILLGAGTLLIGVGLSLRRVSRR